MIRYLIDTNIISELTKARPTAGVRTFLASLTASQLYLSVISLGEIERGIERLPASEQRAQLRGWLLNTVRPRYAGRILDIDEGVMSSWALMVVATGRTPGQLPALDALIAATALHHGLTVVTRNTKDFKIFQVPVLNPFSPPTSDEASL